MDGGSRGRASPAPGRDTRLGEPRGLSPAAALRPPLARRDLGDRGSDGPGRAADRASGRGRDRGPRRPAKLARRVRLLSTGHGRKSDEADALSVGIAAHTATDLRTARIDEHIAALRALTEHRDDLVRARTQTVNRLHTLLAALIPTGLPRGLSADAAAAALRAIRPRTTLARTQRHLAVDLVAEIRRLDKRIAAATEQITAAVTESRTTLTELYGIGTLLAGKILARTGAVERFRSAAAFASFCGVAPLEVSSGDVQRHRLSRAGDRQMNYALHVMAITQIQRDTPGRAYYQRKRADGKSHKEALRCLKRRLSDVVYRTMLRDSEFTLPTPA